MRGWTVRVLQHGAMLLALLGSVLGCERELPFQASAEKPTVGYQIEGFVIDHLGVPLKGVRVAVWYDYEFVDTLQPPSSTFFVNDSTKNILVRVLDRTNKVRATLLEGRFRVGPVNVNWDKRDALGKPVPSGVYTVDFSVNGVSRSSYTIVVDGAITAVTDSVGHYAIPDENLPVGYYPVPLYSPYDSRFIGNHSIASSISLELYLDIHRGASVSVTKDRITRHDFVI